MEQTIFDMMYPKYKITKPIRLIEFFAGYGSQALALKYLGVKFEHWKICEWAVKSIQAYKDIHMTYECDPSGVLDIPKEEIINFLYQKGISSNYNEPMTRQQIDRLNEQQLKTIFNNIKATHNLVNIQQVKGKDLEIVDTDKYDYILTYSFPCQDLSNAGKKAGFNDTSTRSGMLWEVERILDECNEIGQLPQVLLMENVIQIHSSGENTKNFFKWQSKLESLGYKNYMQDLIATDYGIPQTRNRCFMVSILGDYSYTFPKPIPLKLKLKDMLEDNVDEKYYLNEKGMEYICGNAVNPNLKDMYDRSNAVLNRNNAYCLNTKVDRRAGDSNYILNNYDEITIKDFIRIKNATKQGYLEATDGDGIDLAQPNSETRRGRVQKETIQTLTTQNNLGVVTKPKVLGGVGQKDSNNNTQWKQQNRVYDDKVAISVTTAFNPYYKDSLRIRKLTPRECFRLMGVKDEDFDKVRVNQSDSSLYHLAGDSIVCDVLMAIFKEML